MRRPLQASSCIILLSVLALAGCSSSSAPKSLTITFKSPAVIGGSLPARYTCDGQDIAPPLEWGAVPSTTREIAVFVLGLKRNPSTGGYKTTIEWALAGVRPGLHKLAAGELPPGAHVGQASDGKARYSVCPAKGKSEKYQFALYAVPASTEVAPRFVGIAVLDLLANPESKTRANAGGAFVADYERR